MSDLTIDTEIQFVKGVGPRAAATFRKAGFNTAGDLLFRLPRRYLDRSNLPKIREIRGGESVTVRGELINVSGRPISRGRVITKAVLSDGTGYVSLIWFNQPWVYKKLSGSKGEIIAFGSVTMGDGGPEMSSPDYEFIDPDESAENFARLMPVYGLTEGLMQRQVRNAARSVVDGLAGRIPDPLPHTLLAHAQQNPLRWCLEQIHLPDSLETAAQARDRLVYEEFLYLQISLAQRRKEVQSEGGIEFPIDQLLKGTDPAQKAAGTDVSENLFDGELLEQVNSERLQDQITRMLPFKMTGAQERVIKEIWDDMKRPHPMNRLVQGDVGSGKTAVAACAMLAAVRSGFQTAMMAPTEILAEQHFIGLKRLFEPIGIEVVLMAGKLTAKQKKTAKEATSSGSAKIAVGTHALISGDVQFRNLGLVVIDEQHRFGVMQRAALREKSHHNPDVLVMTATPIPRTIAQTEFGDLDISVIDELPPGRRPIKTHSRRLADRRDVYEGVRKLLKDGRQAYFVCPLVSESELMMVQAAEELYQTLSDQIFPEYKVGLLHGKLKTDEKESVMEAFRKNEFQILVCTTIVEVGVDVPNATVMVIEDANRFGLAQLHQLRGRVGRGAYQSFCVLIADPTNLTARERLDIMVQTTDGFKISEKDLELRGAGSIAGTEQSGFLAFQYGDLVKDAVLLSKARADAFQIVDQDPELAGKEWALVREKVKERRSLTAVAAVS